MKRRLIITFLLLTTLSGSALAQSNSIQRYLNIRSASSPTFSPDGKSIAYLTNVTGTQQIWVVDLPDGKPRQLTDYEDNVGFVRWLSDGNIIFGKAKGGDENTQFFWMKRDGSGIRELTSEPKVVTTLPMFLVTARRSIMLRINAIRHTLTFTRWTSRAEKKRSYTSMTVTSILLL